MDQSKNNAPARKKSNLLWVAGAIIVIAVSIMVGMALSQKSPEAQDTTGGSMPRSRTLTGGGGASDSGGSAGTCANGAAKMSLNLGGQMVESCGTPTVGTATAVSDTSLTVKSDSGAEKTFAASDATKVISGDSTVHMSAIKVSDKVIAIPSSDDPNTIAYVLLNPNIQSSGGGTLGTN
jgi:hypothetical protein